MKRHALLAGSSLMAAAVTGAVAYLVTTATVRARPIWPYFILLGVFAVGAALYAAGQDRKHRAPAGAAAQDDTGISVYGTTGLAITDRWRSTTNGREVPVLMRLTHNSMSHPAYMKRATQGNASPSMRIGTVVPCNVLGPTPATSEIRARFLAFLNGPRISGLVNRLTSANNAVWTAWDGHGRMNFGAVLARDRDSDPTAWARLLLPESGTSSYNFGSQCAEFVLNVEPRTADDKPARAVTLAEWRGRFTKTLAIPGALTDFLNQQLDLVTANELPAQVAVWLNSPNSLTELVDTEDLQSLPGSPAANWFTGYAVADHNGHDPADLAREWLREMCDNMLHLDSYEPTLEVLSNPDQYSACLPAKAMLTMRKLEDHQSSGDPRKHEDSAGTDYINAYEEFTKKFLTSLEGVKKGKSAHSIARQIAQEIRIASTEVPEFYVEEFYNIFKDAVVTKVRTDMKDCGLVLQDAKSEAASATAELQERLDIAMTAKNKRAEHEIWREREIKQTACQAKIDGVTNRVTILGLKIDICNELAQLLELSFS